MPPAPVRMFTVWVVPLLEVPHTNARTVPVADVPTPLGKLLQLALGDTPCGAGQVPMEDRV